MAVNALKTVFSRKSIFGHPVYEDFQISERRIVCAR